MGAIANVLLGAASAAAAARAAPLPPDPARPGYHYTRPYGWQNDPVPYRDAAGVYHLFPLCDPNATTQWKLPSDHSAWCHATSTDMATSWTTHRPALMTGPWPGGRGVGGTGNVITRLPESEQRRLNATSAIVTGGAFMWLSSDPSLMTWRSGGGLFAAGADGPAASSHPAPGVVYCGDVHVYQHNGWRVAGAGSDGACMDAANTTIRPKVLIYEADHLQYGGWRYVSTLYTGDAGDGPRVECPTYFSIGSTAVLLFSKTGAPGHATHGTYWATGTEDASGVMSVQKHGAQQHGGYANEAFEDVQNSRWIVYSWLQVQGTTSCSNSFHRRLSPCWVGAQSLPRVVSLQSDGSLKFPVAVSSTLCSAENSRLEAAERSVGPQPEMEKLLGTATMQSHSFRSASGLQKVSLGSTGVQARLSVSVSGVTKPTNSR